jgi:chitinase
MVWNSSSAAVVGTRLLLSMLSFAVLVGSREASGAQLTASWVDNSGGVANTSLQRRAATDTVYAPIANVAPGVTTYVDASVNTGTSYCYRAQAYDASGVSGFSNETCATASTGLDLVVTVSEAGTGSGTVASTPAGINCGTTCSAAFLDGTAVTLAATAAAGSAFAGWSGGGCAGTAPCTFTGNAPVTVTASFNPVPVPVTVGFSTPTNGSTVQQTVTVAASASGTVSSVGLSLDGAVITSASGLSASYAWNTTTVSNGTHSWTATAYDTGGNSLATSMITTTVNNPVAPSSDTTAPLVTLTLPSTTFTRRSTVTLGATASDNVGVVKVEFYVDGSLLCSDASSPYTCAWHIAAANNKSYILQAKAYDAAGNVGLSPRITVFPQ